MKRKTLLIALMTLIITVFVGVGTTVAYFVSLSGPVRNTFTVGKVELDLTETTGDEYPMIPGTDVDKDPFVTVRGSSEECFVYVKLNRTGGFDDYATFEIADGWERLGGFDGVYYRTVGKSGVDKVYPVLKDNKVSIKSNLNKEKMAAIKSSGALPQLEITAFAIQTLGIETAAEGWHNILTEYGSDGR